MKKITCECGIRYSPWQQKLHKRSIWHVNWELIKRCIAAKMNKSEIARTLGVSPAYVSIRIRKGIARG